VLGPLQAARRGLQARIGRSSLSNLLTRLMQDGETRPNMRPAKLMERGRWELSARRERRENGSEAVGQYQLTEYDKVPESQPRWPRHPDRGLPLSAVPDSGSTASPESSTTRPERPGSALFAGVLLFYSVHTGLRLADYPEPKMTSRDLRD
jgi:hypothetical protein